MSDLKPLNATHFRILAALRAYGSLTPRSFDRQPVIDGGDEIDRLAPRILELREHGYNIETVIERTARGKRYARYFLRGEPADARPVAQGDPEAQVEPEPTSLFDLQRTPFDPYGEAA
jgi:hypothetical protein